MQLSIVTTLYQSAPYIDEFIHRITGCARQISDDYELLLVNDGSPDNSLQKALIHKSADSRIKIIDLSRNFGHHAAGMAGLEQAQGEFVFLIDSDLEEAPELLIEFWRELQLLQDVDMLYGIQKQRRGTGFKQISGELFYYVFNKLSRFKIEPNVMTVRLMRKQFVEALCRYQERNLFIAGIMAHAGFKQQSKIIEKSIKTESTYTLLKQLKLALFSIVGFSDKPLHALFLTGIIFTLLTLAFAAYLFIPALFWKTLVSVNEVLLLATLFISTLIFLCSGLLGLYLSNINEEIKHRPRTHIKRIY